MDGCGDSRALALDRSLTNQEDNNMRVSKENVEVKMQVPGAVLRQRTNFGDVTGFSKFAAE